MTVNSPEDPQSRRTAPMTGRSCYRPLVFAIAAALSVLVLRGAGFQPTEWWKQRQASAALNAPRPAPAGPISVVQPTPLGTDASVSPVPLALHLVATRLGRNPSEGYADIGVNARSPQTYRARALLANGARVDEIYADHVVLKRDGHSTELYLDGTARRNAQGDSNSLVAGSVLTVGGTKPVQMAVADTQDEFSRRIRVSPEYDEDDLKGLRVYPGPDAAAFQRLGLEPGDRITTMDGHSIVDVPAAIEALRRLDHGSALVVSVQRGSQIERISLDGAALRSDIVRGR